MKFNDFVDAVREAGWRNVNDAQHTGLKKLHKKLFPVVAELESDMEDLDRELRQAQWSAKCAEGSGT